MATILMRAVKDASCSASGGEPLRHDALATELQAVSINDRAVALEMIVDDDR
jgi:hypothetical protein